MLYSQAIFLAIIQGLTEFLPISSSGHLVIFQKLFGLEPPVLFDILVHVGTLGAVLVYFRKELLKISRQTIWLIIVGTIPAVIVGLFLQGYIEQIFNSLRLVGLTLLVTAGFLFSTRWLKSFNCQLNQLKWTDALFVGAFQALAILPGISRSGATIVSGLWRQFDREIAFRFSFYLAIPAILGALILQTPDLLQLYQGEFCQASSWQMSRSSADLPAEASAQAGGGVAIQAYEADQEEASLYSPCAYLGQGILGMFIAGAVGYGALKILEKTLTKAKFWLFGIYCFLLGLFLLLLPFS